MVCERDPGSPNDPAEGRIVLLREGDWLTADGTTLGADDGIAIAAMMTLVEDESIPHGPLELLMTVAEEVGLEGASALDGSLLTGSTLINLDSQEDGVLTVGCAGSTDTWVRVDAPRAACSADAITLSVVAGGGLGGHSGVQIALGRSNAIKVLGRVLREAAGSCHSGSSLSTVARAETRYLAMRWRSAPSRAIRRSIPGRGRVGDSRREDAYAKTDPGATETVESAAAPMTPGRRSRRARSSTSSRPSRPGHSR